MFVDPDMLLRVGHQGQKQEHFWCVMNSGPAVYSMSTDELLTISMIRCYDRKVIPLGLESEHAHGPD